MRAALPVAVALLAAYPAAAQTEGEDGARRWTLTVEKEEALLVYAVPDSDDLSLSLRCRRDTGQIVISFLTETRLAARRAGQVWLDKIGRPAPWPTSVTVVTPSARTTVRGQAEPEEMYGGSLVSVELADRAPVMADFGKTGRLRLEALGEVGEEAPARPGEVRRFLRACR